MNNFYTIIKIIGYFISSLKIATLYQKIIAAKKKFKSKILYSFSINFYSLII